MKKIIGYIAITAGYIFVYLETKHFGSNLVPQSKEEWLCDTVGLLLIICGGIIVNNKKESV